MPPKMDAHETFAKWAVEQGVEINGLVAHSFEGRGLGIMAETDLKVCVTVMASLISRS